MFLQICNSSLSSLRYFRTCLCHSSMVPRKKLEFKYSRSSGPGGQNVNKSNTKVELRFHLENADWLKQETKLKIVERYGNKLSSDGYLHIVSEKSKSVQLNEADAIHKLEEIIKEADYVPPPTCPQKIIKIEKLKNAANKQRISEKRHKSMIKKFKKEIW